MVWILLYGILCYMFGVSSKQAQLQLSMDVQHSFKEETAQSAQNNIHNKLLRYDNATCGIVFFYHLPSTGGATINQWLLQYKEESVPYYTMWGGGPRKMQNDTQTSFINGMNDFILNLTQDQWKVVHAHHNSLHLNQSETLLYQWRSIVESQGCYMVNAIMLRDALSNTMSKYRYLVRDLGSDNSTTRKEWISHLHTKSEMGYFSTQLDYFLYNYLSRNPYKLEKEAKVNRALQLLRDHFDIVVVGDHNRFEKELLSITKWEKKTMKRHNTGGDTPFNKSEVELLQRLLQDNGDIDFIYKVRDVYMA